MRDYIDILLNTLREELPRFEVEDNEFLRLQEKGEKAEEALRATMSEEQMRLYIAADEAQNAVSARYDAVMCRRIFHLAKAIYQ